MRIRRLIYVSLTSLYATATAALIIVTSQVGYESMIGEVDDGKPITICTLPPSIDNARDIYAPGTLVLVLALTILGIGLLKRHRRIDMSLVLSIALVLIWTYRFFFRTFGC